MRSVVMPDWQALVGDITLVQTILWLVAAGLALGVIIKLWPFVKNAVAIVDALVTLPAMAQQVKSIHHELHPNGGSSMNDSLRRVEETAERLELGVRGLYDEVGLLRAEDKRLAEADDQLRRDIENTHPNPKEQ